MAVNRYFNNSRPNNEMNLFENLIVEAIQVYGVEVVYIPRTIVTSDEVLNEVTSSSFNRGFIIEAYIENFEGFAPNNFFMDRLGMESPQSGATVSVSKRRFREEVPDEYLTAAGRPNEGDLVFVPHLSVLLEIKSAGTDLPGKSGGSVHAYRLECQLYKHSRSDFTDADEDSPLSELMEIPEEFSADVQPIKDYEGDNEFIEQTSTVIQDRR